MKTILRTRYWIPLLVLALALSVSCGRTPQTRPESSVSPRTESVAKAAEVPHGDADLLQNVAVGAAATNTALLEADKAWEKLIVAMRPPSYPPEWETNPPTKEALAEFQKKNGALALQIADQAKDFYTKFPKHEMASEARDRERYLLGVAMQVGNSNVIQRLQSIEENRLKDPNLSEDERLQLRVAQIQRKVMSVAGTNLADRLTEFEKGARALLKEFPARPEVSGLLLSVAQGWLDQGNVDKARTLATEVAEGKGQEETKAEAQSLLKKLARLGKPVAIKFTAVDGRQVDLQSLKGKVVLVDFWASWCAPCMAEMPHVKAAYAKLKPKGFEVVGINLDQDKGALQKVVSDLEIAWPQHFEDKAEHNHFAEEFEVASIPAMWLIDKKGNLRDLNAREDLAEKVAQLLAE